MTRAAFFFGAGISKPSGKPLAPEITRAALEDEWHLSTDRRFCPGRKQNPHHVRCVEDSVTPLVQQFLAILKHMAAYCISELSRASTPRAVHYEDFFSLAEQVFRAEDDHAPNLVLAELLLRVRRDAASLYGGFEVWPSGGLGLAGLAETTCDFLHWVVYHKLSTNVTPRAGLAFLSDTAKQVEELDIFTLNHDVLIEDQLKATYSHFEDGFADSQHGEFRAFSGWPRSNRKKIRLFKLHGSINWYIYDFPNLTAPTPLRKYAIPLKGPSHSRDQTGTVLKPVDVKAAFLSGTVVKERRYGTGMFADLFAEFRRHLSLHNQLICCGYGFGDTGINNHIHNWLSGSLNGSKKLIVFTEEQEQRFFENKPIWMQTLEHFK